MKKLGYGLIGFGGIAENRISKEGFGLDKERFDGHPHAELLAATDVNQERKQAAEKLGLVWHKSVEELLGHPGIDAVYVATNNKSHYAAARSALEAGKHCIVEKPVATRLRDARALSELAVKKGLSLSVDHMMTQNVYNIRARELVRDGELGEVNDLSLHMEFLYGGTEEEAKTWRCSDPGELGGPIGDVGSHCLYMAEYFLDDEIEEISCVFTPPTIDIKVENGAYIRFLTGKGIWGTVRVAFDLPRGGLVGTLSNLGFEIYGTRAVLRSHGTLFQLSGHPGEPVKLHMEIESSEGTETLGNLPPENIYQRQISKHVTSVLENEPDDNAGGIHNLELILACFASAERQGEAVRIA